MDAHFDAGRPILRRVSGGMLRLLQDAHAGGEAMIVQRPRPVGKYHVLQDFVCPDASVRVLRLEGAAERVEPHLHHHSMQIYLAIEGGAVITVDGEERVLEPFGATAVWPGMAHSASALGGTATVVNISIPPLEGDDQFEVTPFAEPPDVRLPRGAEDSID